MPIKPENRARYPANWKDIRVAILKRAGNACEFCGATNGRPHPITNSRVVLTIAHLDHTPEHNDPANLRALCQRCHLAYDAEHHAQTAYRNRRTGKAAGDLFDAHLCLNEAATLLKMSSEALRQRAKAGRIPAYKPGKRWVFLETDLHAYLIGDYAEHGQALRATTTHGGKQPCRSINAEKCGGFALPPPTASAYTNLLKLPTAQPPKNSTTR